MSNDYLFVAAIDFGTTYSGYAFASLDDVKHTPCKTSVNMWNAGTLISHKAPTTVLFKPDKTFHSFGYDAENHYGDLAFDKENKDWYFFRRFKMTLFDKLSLKRRYMLEDAMGNKMPAIDVFAAAIGALKNHLMKVIDSRLTNNVTDSDIRWVITVPAIWNDASKQFMRESAVKGGLSCDHLLVALEPEAASLFCHHLPLDQFKGTGKGTEFKPLQPGSKYVVFDAGGGTVDITVHDVDNDAKLRELYKASGGKWGGAYVDQAFRDLLADIVENDVMDDFEASCMGDYIDLFREFEIKKRTFTQDITSKLTFKVPVALNDKFKEAKKIDIKDHLKTKTKYNGKIDWHTDKLRMDADLAKGLFAPSCDSAAAHLKGLFEKPELRGVSTVLMVGGFSESPMLQVAVKKALGPGVRLVIPAEAGLAVLKGAVLFGHFPDAISMRRCRYTYGVKTSIPFIEGTHPESKKFTDDEGQPYCGDIFDKHIGIGDPVVYGESQVTQSYSPTHKSTDSLVVKVYASTQPSQTFVTDPDVKCLGRLEISLDPKSVDKFVDVEMIFSGTELEVKAKEKLTGKITKAKFDFLG